MTSTHRWTIVGVLLTWLGPSWAPSSSWGPAFACKAYGQGGQEIRWFTDYTKARHEAARTGKPLIIDLGTEECFWCRQLDVRTFRDPTLVTLLNERCVMLRVDCNHQVDLAKALKVERYPTLVLGSPEGAVLDYQEGFIEAGPLREKVLRILDTLTPPPWMIRDFDAANRALNTKNYPQALSLLRNVLSDGKERAIQRKARQLLTGLEGQAQDQWLKARSLANKGQTREALSLLTEVAQNYPETVPAREAKMLVNRLALKEEGAADRSRRARELMQSAREDYRTEQYLCCLDRCELLTSEYADLPEAAEAAKLASELRGNPEWARKAAEQTSERLCVLYLSLADTSLQRGQPKQAIYYLERIVTLFPTSRHEPVARSRLARLRGGPVMQAPVTVDGRDR